MSTLGSSAKAASCETKKVTSPVGTFLAVDFDNIFGSLGRPPFTLKRGEAREATLKLIALVHQHTLDAGHKIATARAFADWAVEAQAQRPLSLMGIQPIYVPAQRDKSSADIALSLEVLATILKDDRVQQVTIVGGDRDFLPIAMQLRELGCSLTVATLRSAMGADFRAFMGNWAQGTILELDTWLELPVDPDDSGVFEKPAGNLTAASAVEPEPARNSLEPRVAVALTNQTPALTAEHLRLFDVLRAFMKARRANEVCLAPFYRYLRDQEVLGAPLGTHPRKLMDDLQALGLMEVETRPGERGFAYAVAVLHVDRLPMEAE